MDEERFNTLFSLRCASRLLERQARLYRRMDYLVRMISFFAGTAAFASIMSGRPYVTLSIGVLLALAQAVQLIVRPGEHAAHFLRCAALYDKPASAHRKYSDDELAQALDEAREKDDSTEIQSLRLAAWNDAARELGRGDAMKPLKGVERVMAALA